MISSGCLKSPRIQLEKILRCSQRGKKSSIVLATLVCLLVLLPWQQLQAQPGHDDPGWVTTWATSVSTLPPSTPPESSLHNQTVRLIVHTSVGGDAVRLRIANTHGDKPVTIGSASIALQDDDAPSSAHFLQPITFAGQVNITIPRGAVVFSDPLNMSIPSDDNLAVSLYIEGDSGFVTAHELSNQISYISTTGDYSDDAALPVASETESWPFLTAIDVIPSQPTSAIVTLGDSITDGWGSTMSANHRWPNFFARRLYQDDRSKDYAVVNAGISGNRVTTEQNPTFGQNLQARFERDVLALSNISHIILLEGVNDIGMSFRSDNPVSASDIIAGYHQIIARAHARGIKVIGATLLPYEDAGYYSEAGNTVRQEVNTFIRSSGAFDGVIEFSQAVADPANANRIRAEFTADNLHPNDDGYAAMAEIIDLGLFQ